jgi:hypothetical protein
VIIMALTMTELCGAEGFTATGLTEGGAIKAIVPPVAVYDAGPLAIVAWLLEQLAAAVAADATAAAAGVIQRRVSTQDQKIQQVFTVTLTADLADIDTSFATSVDDNFS